MAMSNVTAEFPATRAYPPPCCRFFFCAYHLHLFLLFFLPPISLTFCVTFYPFQRPLMSILFSTSVRTTMFIDSCFSSPLSVAFLSLSLSLSSTFKICLYETARHTYLPLLLSTAVGLWLRSATSFYESSPFPLLLSRPLIHL